MFNIWRHFLELVWAVNKFRGYFEGSKIYLQTDHQPLRWLMNLKSPSGPLQLQAHDIEIKYMKGRQNSDADMLSRPPICNFNVFEVDMPTKSEKEIREEMKR